MVKRYPEEPTAESMEGTLAAEVLHCMITGKPIPSGAGVEMRETVADVAAYVLGLELSEIRTEELLTGRVIHDSQNYGTPDVIGWKGMHLHVLDQKYGFAYVNHVGNWQCINYAALELERATIDGLIEQRVTVHIHIAQPRCFHAEPFREWVVPATDLRAYINTLRMSAEKVMRMERKATTGPHCLHCPGRTSCQSFQTVAGRVIDTSLGLSPNDMNPASMAAAYQLADAAINRLTAFKNGLEAQIMHAMRGGAQIPGLMIERSAGREEWTAPPEVVADMAAMLGIPEAVTTKIATPAQTRVLLKRVGLPDNTLDSLSERKGGSVKLVPSKSFPT